MPRYAVPLTTTISAIVVVEAPDEDAAIEKAVDNGPQTDFAFSNFESDEWDYDEHSKVVETDRELSDWFDHDDIEA